MDEDEKTRRMMLAKSADDWVALYKEIFKDDPQLSGENWGEYPIEEIVDAINDGKALREPELESGVVA
jgi:hypothetical protein